MIKRLCAFAAIGIALALPAFAASRITFTRVIPPPHDLGGADSIAIVYAIGDSDKVTAFVDHFVHYAARSGTLHITNAVDSNHHVGFDDKALKELRKRHPADVYIGVSLFSCAGEARNGEIGETNADGQRVRSRVQWFDAACSAKVDARRSDGKRLLTFMTHGEGTSPRVPMVGDDERDIAYEQAARYAAITAAESISPRLLRESIELDERAPDFDEALSLIERERLAEARALWEKALARDRNSGPTLYNLGVVSEALGESQSALDYFRSAVRVAPEDARYRTALDSCRKRMGTR